MILLVLSLPVSTFVGNACVHVFFVFMSYTLCSVHDRVAWHLITAFSGMRALNFVLENPRVDRTLLFNVKVIRVDKTIGDGKGGFVRGS